MLAGNEAHWARDVNQWKEYMLGRPEVLSWIHNISKVSRQIKTKQQKKTKMKPGSLALKLWSQWNVHTCISKYTCLPESQCGRTTDKVFLLLFGFWDEVLLCSQAGLPNTYSSKISSCLSFLSNLDPRLMSHFKKGFFGVTLLLRNSVELALDVNCVSMTVHDYVYWNFCYCSSNQFVKIGKHNGIFLFPEVWPSWPFALIVSKSPLLKRKKILFCKGDWLHFIIKGNTEKLA